MICICGYVYPSGGDLVHELYCRPRRQRELQIEEERQRRILRAESPYRCACGLSFETPESRKSHARSCPSANARHMTMSAEDIRSWIVASPFPLYLGIDLADPNSSGATVRFRYEGDPPALTVVADEDHQTDQPTKQEEN